jgi:hypothetical protein
MAKARQANGVGNSRFSSLTITIATVVAGTIIAIMRISIATADANA